MATLYIVATPIGNLEDISMRALRILREADMVLCEDTRVTRKLLDHYDIDTPTMSYHQHSNENKTRQILEILEQGKDLALVSDAGTPCISDPGGKLVEAVFSHFSDRVKIESVPGASAVTAALSISGMPTDKFVFMGFPPHKKGRNKFIESIIRSDFPVVVYESKHRIIKFLNELKEADAKLRVAAEIKKTSVYQKKDKDVIAKKGLNSVVVCRELSKMHETVYRGELNDIIKKINESSNDQKGEFVVIIA